MNKSVILGIEIAAVIGIGGMIVYSLVAPPRLANIYISDPASHKIYDVLRDQTVDPKSKFQESLFNRNQANQLMTFYTREPINTDVRYRVTTFEQSGFTSMPATSRLLYQEREVKIALPQVPEGSSMPCKIEASNGKWQEIWSGEVGQDTQTARWNLLNPIKSVDISGLIDAKDAKTVCLKVVSDKSTEDVYTTQVVSHNGTIHFRLVGDHSGAKFVKLFRQDYREIFNQPVVFGRKGTERELPKPVAQALLESVSKLDWFEAKETWTSNGTKIETATIRCPMSVAPTQLDKNNLYALAVRLPKPESDLVSATAAYSNPKVKLGHVSSSARSQSQSLTVHFFFYAPKEEAKTDVDVLVPDGPLTLAKTITKRTANRPGEDEYTFETLSFGSLHRVSVRGFPGKAGKIIVHLKKGGFGTQFEGGNGFDSFEWSTSIPGYLKTEEIDRVEVWTCDSKEYKFKDVPLRPTLPSPTIVGEGRVRVNRSHKGKDYVEGERKRIGE
jgi:hypothetical protein